MRPATDPGRNQRRSGLDCTKRVCGVGILRRHRSTRVNRVQNLPTFPSDSREDGIINKTTTYSPEVRDRIKDRDPDAKGLDSGPVQKKEEAEEASE